MYLELLFFVSAFIMNDKKMRQLIAMEAARLMVEHGIKDYYAAKRKATAQLGARDGQNMPRNQEIEQALADYQRLFKADTQPRRLQELRATAAEAMRFFASFSPRLVGSVLSGTAHEHSDVNLHLFSDIPEEVRLFLIHEKIPFDTLERQLRLAGDDPTTTYPGYRFIAGETAMDLTVFPVDGLRQAPRSPVDGKPMARAALAVVLNLIDKKV